jgi:hypothetical protein
MTTFMWVPQSEPTGVHTFRPDDVGFAHQVGGRSLGSGEAGKEPRVEVADLDLQSPSMVGLHPSGLKRAVVVG